MGTGTTLRQALGDLTQLSKLEKTSERYDHIELTEEELDEALVAAREKKHYKLKREAYNEEIRRPPAPKKFTAEEILEAYRLSFTIDEYNERHVKNLAYYFTDDTRFDGNLKKGLLLVGPVGIGKTALMQFFKRNQKGSFKVISCRDIEREFSSDGEKTIQQHSFNIPIAINSSPFCQNEIGFCFDDLGTETNGKHFGKEKNVMAEIILNRYDNNISHHLTHITTNLTAEEIKDQYGSRVTDRMKQMLNLIVFNKMAPSRRV